MLALIALLSCDPEPCWHYTRKLDPACPCSDWTDWGSSERCRPDQTLTLGVDAGGDVMTFCICDEVGK